MSSPVQVTVNDMGLAADPQQSLLANLLAAGIDIPHLCYHPALPPQGRCSLCLVEMLDGDQWRTEHACLLKAHDGMIIRTVSEALTRARSLAALLLRRRGEFRNQATLQMLNELTGKSHHETRQESPQTGCILCGLCISMCHKIGRKRLTFLGRGPALAVGYVSDQASCDSCHACASVCPTGYIIDSGASTFKPQIYGQKNRLESI